MADVVVVGVGRIGLGVAASLVRAGHAVRAVDVRAEVRADVEAVGARWGGAAVGTLTPAQVLLTVLPGSPELRRLMLGDAASGSGALGRMTAGANWIDLTSAAPDLARELATTARRRGVRYVDAAIGGGADDAARADLTLYVGGDAEVVAQNRPILQALARREGIHHMGDSGAGYLTKLLINQLWFTHALALAEAMVLGAAEHLEPARLLEVLPATAAGSTFADDYGPLLLRGDVVPLFGLDRIVEELDSLQRAAHAHALPPALSERVAAIHRSALEHYGPVPGELLGVAYLEHLAHPRMSDRPDSSRGSIRTDHGSGSSSSSAAPGSAPV